MPFLIIWLLFGICAAVVASNRGANGFLWFCLGAVLGPIGFALAFTTGTKCPECGSKISEKASICPSCKHRLIKPDDPEWNRPPPMPQQSKTCPFCAEQILVDAKKCRYCGEFLGKPSA
jgi:hypothetical protein